MFLNELVELFGFFSSVGIKSVEFSLVISDFLGFGVDNTGHDGSSGVEISF